MIGQYGIISEYLIIDVLISEGINIFVKTFNGNSVKFTVLSKQNIRDIRKAIQYEKRINVEEQILIYQDKILEDGKTFAEYGISNKSIIWAVEYRKEMQIIVIIIEELSIVFHVDKVNNIHHLMKKIEEKIRKKLDKYDLQYKDIILNENDEDLMKYEIDESVIFIKAIPRMKIFVKTRIGRTILMKLKQNGKVKDIKYYIQEQIGLHPTEQKLIYEGKILDDDDKSIIDYQICENSLIHIYDKIEIQIVVTTIDGKSFALQMRKTDKIIELKNKIMDKMRIRPNEQTLTYQGILLKDENTFNDYEINDGSVIRIVIPMSGGVNVAVKVHDVFAFNINVQNNEIIGEVKRRIGLEIDLPADDLKLNFQTLILHDNDTLGNYQLSNGSETVIDVQLRDEINIIFTTMDKNRFQMKYLKQSYKISDLKLRIEERIKIHREMQILIYNKNVLNDDDKSISDYQILDYSIINIEIENKILCDMNDKMSHIRTKIENGIQLDSQHRVLIFERKLLENDKVFIYFQIKNRQEVIIDENFKNFKNAIKFNQLEDVKIHFVNEYLHVKYGSYLNNPIHYASKYASEEIINFLIEKKCDLEITELENRTPLHLACIHGNIEAIQILIDNNCNINAMDYLKRRPIHLACENNHKDIVDLLIKNKCEIDICDCFDRCPLDIAKQSKLDDIINIIYARKVADVMRLSCNDGCDHKFCFKSIVSNQFKGTLIYEEGLVKIYWCEESGTDSRKKFAYKKFDKKSISKYIEGKINDFVEIIRNVRIIEYFGGFEIKRNKFVFMEFIETGSLQKQIGDSNLPIMKIIKQLLEALEFLHRKEIIHRDIKPDNILLDGLRNIKLIDFEFSCELSILEEETSLDAKFCGTLHYMAPEIMNDEMYSCSVDIWSLGVTVIEMATGAKPYNSLKQCDFIDKILTTRKIIYELPISLQDSENLKLLIDQMLISDGSKRFGAQELINNFCAYFPNYLHEY